MCGVDCGFGASQTSPNHPRLMGAQNSPRGRCHSNIWNRNHQQRIQLSHINAALGRTDKGNPLKGLRYAWIENFACRR